MNKKQKLVIYAAVVLLAAMAIFVPFAGIAGMEPSYDFIWNRTVKVGSFKVGQLALDYERIALQVAALLALTFAGLWFFKGKAKGKRK